MTRRQWAVSAFLVWHLAAMVVAAIPAPADLPAVGAVREPDHGAALSRALTPLFDASAAAVAELDSGLWPVASTARTFTAPYMRALGLGQRWRMFANPPPYDQYLRLRYYVTPSSSTGLPSGWTTMELVLPAHREDRVRLLQSFRDSYRDKAIASALDRFHRAGDGEAVGRFSEGSREELTPVARYFARQFEREHLAGGERIVRIELWHGIAPNTWRAGASALERLERRSARQLDLSTYTGGAARTSLPTPVSYPDYGQTEQESDISWRLVYIEGP